jgi:hypothetical protein
LPTHAWNDRVAGALDGRPTTRGQLQVLAGEVSALTTFVVDAGAHVHHLHLDAHSGDATFTFPGGQFLHVHNGDTVTLDFRGLLAGGTFTLDGGGAHYLLSYLLPG